MASLAENADPNLSAVVADAAGKPPRSKKLRVSISPKKPTVLSPGSTRARRRRSSSHFGNKGKKLTVDDTDDEMSVNNNDDEEDSDIEFTLEGATNIDTGDKNTISSTPTSSNSNNKGKKKKTKKPQQQQRRRRRSSARFLRLSSGGGNDGDNSGGSPGSNNNDDDDNEYTSSEHLGEIYRQAIRMNAENKINAGNSWGLKLIENMDKFIVDNTNTNTTTGEEGGGGDVSPRDNARDELKAARKMKSKDEKGRVNFTKASCTLDASVKIYSYRVDDVHLSSYRVLANLNRTDNNTNNKGNDGDDDEGGVGGGGGESGGGEKVVKRRTGPRGPTETLESNMGMYLFCWCCLKDLQSVYVSQPLTNLISSHIPNKFCLIQTFVTVPMYQPTLTCPSLIQPTISTHSFTRCPSHSTRVVPRDCYLVIWACLSMDVTLYSIPRKRMRRMLVSRSWTRLARRMRRRRRMKISMAREEKVETTSLTLTPKRQRCGTRVRSILPTWPPSLNRC